MQWSGETIWILEVNFPPGRYEYKALVDGREWWNDAEAPAVPNVWGTEDSETSGEIAP